MTKHQTARYCAQVRNSLGLDGLARVKSLTEQESGTG